MSKKPATAEKTRKAGKRTAATPVAKNLTTAQKLNVIGIDSICSRVANCEFLQNIADDCGLSRGSLVKWLESDVNAALYARAREAQADKMAEDILSIADELVIEAKYQGEAVMLDVSSTSVARNRLRVDARKWLAAKMLPKKYGDRIQNDTTLEAGSGLLGVLASLTKKLS